MGFEQSRKWLEVERLAWPHGDVPAIVAALTAKIKVPPGVFQTVWKSPLSFCLCQVAQVAEEMARKRRGDEEENNAAGPRNVKWGRGAGGLKVSAGNKASRENTFIFCYMNNLPHHRRCRLAPPPLHPCIMFFFIAGKGVGKKAAGGWDTGEGLGKGRKRGRTWKGTSLGERRPTSRRTSVHLIRVVFRDSADGPHGDRMSPPNGCWTPAHRHKRWRSFKTDILHI